MLNEFQKRALQIAQAVATRMQNMLSTPRGKVIGEEPYWYTHTPVTVNAGTSAQVSIPIQSDADFDAYYLSGVTIDTATNLTTNTNCTIQITDSGTGRTFYSNPVLLPVALGSGGTPYILQNVRQFKQKSNITIALQNNTALNLLIQIVFGGTKVFYENN